MRDQLAQHLDQHSLIKNSQHGFSKTFLEFVTACIDDKLNVDTVNLDLAKAFDKVPHQRLLLKLKVHDIDGLVCNWILAWLADRKQWVCQDGSCSS